MSLVLAFDTSGGYCATALLDGDDIRIRRYEEMTKGQVERLMPLLEDTLADAGKTWADLDRIGVGIGPGNFTGIRIAVSAARGLALSLNIPAIGVSMLEAQSYGLDGCVVSCLDARQNRAYTQVFINGQPEPPAMSKTGMADIPPPKLNSVITGSFAGPVADALNLPVVQNQISPVEAIARISAARKPDGSRPAPLYLRPADAAPSKDPAPVIL